MGVELLRRRRTGLGEKKKKSGLRWTIEVFLDYVSTDTLRLPV